ncbi:MAG: S8 family serine peptidase, partial [Lachnospiraceae bacterium]|nr:S8 family serine peptidase [Lachnospiraceae bacterium]
CDTEGEAEKIAEGYAKSTGYTVTVESFRYGVALLKISGRPSTDKLIGNAGTASLDSVETFVKLSADTSNNLPAVYPNYYREAYSVNDTSNEEEFRDPMLQVHSEQYEGMYQWYHNKVNDKYVWDKIDKSGSSLKTNLQQIHVAVLDTGINYEHADFGTVTHQNFVSLENESGQTAYEKGGGDTDGHGTNVAGIIANIANNNIGGRGVAAGVVLDSYRVLNRDGSGSDDDILVGLKKVVQDKGSKDIRVINMSLGGGSYNSAYEAVLLEARKKGILVIAASGNDDVSSYHYPAAYEGVMSVAALNASYEKSSFSNYGDWVDIAAPGGENAVDLNSPTFSGAQPLWASGKKDAGAGIRTVNGQNYEGMNGTSQATPVTSGCAALLFASNLSFSPSDVESILKETARPLKSRYALGAGCVDIAAAMNIDTFVPTPQASIESGVIPSGQNIVISLPNGYEYSKYAVIYYTLNGKKPLDPNTKAEAVRTCKSGTSIKLEGAGSVTLCMQTLLFGSESVVSEYKYTFEESQVETIKVSIPGNITVTAEKGQPSTVFPAGNVAEIAIDKTVAFTAEALPAFAKNRKLTWASSNPEFATVDANGKVKGICEGSAEITVSSADGYTVAVIPVEVKKVPDQIQILKESINLTVGDKETYKFTTDEIKVLPSEASQHFVLKSLNEKVAVIKLDSNGKQYVEAIAPGETSVTATTADGSNLSDTVAVYVGSKIKNIVISDPSGVGAITKGMNFTPKVVLNDGNSITEGSTEVNWKIVSPSDAQSYFKVNNDGSFKIEQGYSISSPKEIKVQAYSGSVSSNVLTLTLYNPTSYITYSDFASEFVWGYYAFIKDTSLDLSSMFKINPDTANPKLKYTVSGARLNPDTGYALLDKTGIVYVKAEATDGSGRSYQINFYVRGKEASFEGLKYKSVNPVIYPGSSLNIETVFANGSFAIPSVYKFMIYNE